MPTKKYSELEISKNFHRVEKLDFSNRQKFSRQVKILQTNQSVKNFGASKGWSAGQFRSFEYFAILKFWKSTKSGRHEWSPL